jgi:DNA repair protein RecO (recombination protein O)
VSASTIMTGMVLSAMSVGDYDKRLVILTKESGKISVFAKGAHKPNSALLACSEPFAFGIFTLYQGRNSYNIISAEISNYFAELRQDFAALCYGLYFCEFADYITKENSDEREILRLLYQTLKALVKKTIPTPLIRAIFELKSLTLSGEEPQVFYCVKCEERQQKPNADKKKKNYRFSAVCGGILCEDCWAYDKNAITIDTSTLYAMQYIISKGIEKLYTFKVTDKIQWELSHCIKSCLDCCIGHEFKALDMLRILYKHF